VSTRVACGLRGRSGVEPEGGGDNPGVGPLGPDVVGEEGEDPAGVELDAREGKDTSTDGPDRELLVGSDHVQDLVDEALGLLR
jgi:hypothetical protein